MGCPRLTYHLTAEPRLRVVYNAADEEESHVVRRAVAAPVIWRIHTADDDAPCMYMPEYRMYIACAVDVTREEKSVQWFLSPDPYVQAPTFSQSYNRYAYCLNNPLIYTDPSGEKWWHWLIGGLGLDALTGGAFSISALTTAGAISGTATATITATGTATFATYLPFSNENYEMQKFISPIAFKLNFNFGSIQNGIGFDISAGMLKGAGVTGRMHYGKTFWWSSYGGYKGWETRKGYELETLPLITYSSTKFTAGQYSQTTAMLTIGDPFTSVSYENDNLFGGSDGGDRWRTAAVQMKTGFTSINLNMFTGDPGFNVDERKTDSEWVRDVFNKRHKAYTQFDANNPDQRAGVLSFSFGPLSIGRNSENIRHNFQNKFAHDWLTSGNAYWFKRLPIAPSWYWSFGTGSGNTLW